ncbi:MAG: purine-nucleoside phosphorylase [Balneolaceae bacterium]|nr:purine-nucleoside phosphorylase [Balneolaceae bacterium]MBO6546993.1 purine-nucleoside phosphorylase [Balneolaceae bacterium]MBO6649353.1 purine-nucleoside phosphorylase [Balneolaceae bacterium]
MSLPDHIHSIHTFLVQNGFPESIHSAVILGSGLGSFGDEILNPTVISYSEIPEFPQSTVEGHSGSLIFGTIGEKTVLAFSGRFHFYEGYGFDKTVLPVQLANAFDVDKLIISNAAGGINLDFRVGDLMIIDSILSPAKELAHLDSSDINKMLADQSVQVQSIAESLDINTQQGSYLYVTGPNYETKAEIHAFRSLGGDAVGMSTAPELIEAAQLGTKAVAISLITNAAAGITDEKLDHAEVKDAADAKKEVFARLVKGLIERLG